jgi:anti-sigma28 factor (negative regulator of flagellin synthesis)
MEAYQMRWSTTSSTEIDATSWTRSAANDQPVRVGSDSGAKSFKRGTSPAYRQALVDRLRLQIANGTYETQTKIDALLPRLVRDLASFGRRTKQSEGWQAGRD